ncbi:hypothetical protein ACIQ6Y_31995 [Streptomyces sp. NPDC096205]|uniref:hypothetical protein n=1 Tax=Streptomyces sp. NPDC096205 TaxID=3366081 RepID=UPI0037F50FCA
MIDSHFLESVMGFPGIDANDLYRDWKFSNRYQIERLKGFMRGVDTRQSAEFAIPLV